MKAKTALKSLLVAGLLLTSTACYSVSLVNRSVTPAEHHRLWRHGFIYGLIGSETDSAGVCGNRPIARVTTFMSVPNMILSAVTGGIYTPMTLSITCGQ